VVLLGLGDHDAIGDDIVHVFRAERGRETEVVDLDGSRSVCQDIGTTVHRVSLQIDRDIDLELPQQARNIGAARSSSLDEPLERAL